MGEAANTSNAIRVQPTHCVPQVLMQDKFWNEQHPDHNNIGSIGSPPAHDGAARPAIAALEDDAPDFDGVD